MCCFVSLQRKHCSVYLASSHSKPKPTPSEQTTMTTFVLPRQKYTNTDPHQRELNDALINYIAGDLLPLSTVDSKPFKNFIRLLDPRFVIPSRRHLSTTLIAEKHQAISTQLKANMRDVDAICLTIDLWSSRHMCSFMGITGHFVKDWTLSSVMLACHRFRGRHTADNILQQYENTMAHFDISNQISHIVTDSASNMLKAFSLPGFVDTDDQDPDESDHATDDDPSDTAFDDPPRLHDLLRSHLPASCEGWT